MPCTAQTTLQRVGNPDPQHAGEALRTRASQTRSAPATSLRGELPQRHSTGQPSAAKRTRFNLASARFVSRDPNRQAPKPSGRTDVHRGSRRPPSRPPARPGAPLSPLLRDLLARPEPLALRARRPSSGYSPPRKLRRDRGLPEATSRAPARQPLLSAPLTLTEAAAPSPETSRPPDPSDGRGWYTEPTPGRKKPPYL